MGWSYQARHSLTRRFHTRWHSGCKRRRFTSGAMLARIETLSVRVHAYRKANDTVIVGELNVVSDHAVAQAEAGSCKLGGDAGIHCVVITRVGLQLVPDQRR